MQEAQIGNVERGEGNTLPAGKFGTKKVTFVWKKVSPLLVPGVEVSQSGFGGAPRCVPFAKTR